jgi:hypothetical protein
MRRRLLQSRVTRQLGLVGIAAGGLAALTGRPLVASVLVPTEFREVVADATLIVRGRVTDVRGVVVPGSGIDTIGTVLVDAVVKGTPSEFVAVRIPGGTVGRSRWIVVGAPTVAVGDRAVFFLKRGSDNALRPVGLSMGIYPVRVESPSGRAVVDPPAVIGRTASPGAIVRGDPRRRPMPVQEFESLVRMVMAAKTVPAKGAGR